MTIEILDRTLKSKPFSRYMNSDGVRAYKHFASVSDDYVPTVQDAAMYLFESMGKKYCDEIGVSVDVSGMVFANTSPIGRSTLAMGKSEKDLTITLWLEDAGQLGFNLRQLEREMDEKLGKGWFYENAGKRITKNLQSQNYQKSKQDMLNIQSKKAHYTGFKLWWIRIKESPRFIRSKIHWAIWDLKKAIKKIIDEEKVKSARRV